MTLTICVVLLVGFALGLRFNFLILYPATIFAAIGTAAYSSGTSGDDIGTTMLMLTLGALAVQMGYLCGLIMYAAIASFFGVAESARTNPTVVGGQTGPRISSVQVLRMASQDADAIHRPSPGAVATAARR